VQQVDADQLYNTFFQQAAERYEHETEKNPNILMIFERRKPKSFFERLPSSITFVRKKSFISKTKWPPLNYGEDLHVFDPFITEGEFVVDEDLYCAEQLRGGLFGTLFRALKDQKEMMDSGFPFPFVVKATRHHGPLFLGRTFMVSLAWIWHSLD